MAKEKREIPDPAAFMAQRSNSASGHPNPNTPGESGRDMPTQTSGAPQGFGGINSPNSPHGNTEPAKKHEGSGKKKSELSPNNKKHAGSMTKGKPGYGMPSKEAVQRRINQPMGKSPAQSHSRSGVLSRFEGFGSPASRS